MVQCGLRTSAGPNRRRQHRRCRLDAPPTPPPEGRVGRAAAACDAQAVLWRLAMRGLGQCSGGLRCTGREAMRGQMRGQCERTLGRERGAHSEQTRGRECRHTGARAGGLGRGLKGGRDTKGTHCCTGPGRDLPGPGRDLPAGPGHAVTRRVTPGAMPCQPRPHYKTHRLADGAEVSLFRVKMF